MESNVTDQSFLLGYFGQIKNQTTLLYAIKEKMFYVGHKTNDGSFIPPNGLYGATFKLHDVENWLPHQTKFIIMKAIKNLRMVWYTLNPLRKEHYKAFLMCSINVEQNNNQWYKICCTFNQPLFINKATNDTISCTIDILDHHPKCIDTVAVGLLAMDENRFVYSYSNQDFAPEKLKARDYEILTATFDGHSVAEVMEYIGLSKTRLHKVKREIIKNLGTINFQEAIHLCKVLDLI